LWLQFASSLDMGTGGVALVVAALAVVLVTRLWTALAHLVWRPYAVARAFARQGIRGPPYRVLVGNGKEVQAMRAATSGDTLDLASHDYIARVMPQYRAWVSLYGKVFLTWSGSTPALFVGSHDMVKRVLFDKAGLYGKTDPGPTILSLMGRGLVFTDGDDWSRHRRVVHPAFAMDKLKSMTGAMAACAAEVIRGWEARAAASGEEGEPEVTVEVGQQFTELTADVISHTAFGSSYRQGKEVFLAQRELQFIAFASINSGMRVPGTQYAPTKANVRRWQLERTVRGTLMAIIDERLAAAKEAKGYGSDLLGLMLEANAGDGDGKRQQQAMSMDEIIDECKTFFFAGHDTTSHLLTWAMFLLGTHPEWQQRLREEVVRECGGAEVPLSGDALNKLKLVSPLPP
jgi:cytochrome P450 family 709